MPPLPPDLQDLMKQVEQADKVADDLASSVSEEQFHWHPDDGRAWSMAQCLEHLATMNDLYGGVVRGAVDAARARGWQRQRPIASTIFGQWFISSQEPPVKRRLRAPTSTQPGSTHTREEILRLYHDAHLKIRAIITDSADLDVNRATFQNPFLPLIRVRVGTALRIMAAHDRRHLWQAERVKRAAGYPK